jgi:hypothetical protein
MCLRINFRKHALVTEQTLVIFVTQWMKVVRTPLQCERYQPQPPAKPEMPYSSLPSEPHVVSYTNPHPMGTAESGLPLPPDSLL